MTDLLSNVVAQYAAYWEKLASLLQLKDYHIANISRDNEHNPNRSVACFTAVLEKWLKEVPSPTWGKLDDSIQKLSVEKQKFNPIGMHCCTVGLVGYYFQAEYIPTVYYSKN